MPACANLPPRWPGHLVLGRRLSLWWPGRWLLDRRLLVVALPLDQCIGCLVFYSGYVSHCEAMKAMLHYSDEMHVLSQLRLAHRKVLLHLDHYNLGITFDEEALGSGRGGLSDGQDEGLIFHHVVHAGELETRCVAQLVAGRRDEDSYHSRPRVPPCSVDETSPCRRGFIGSYGGRSGSPLHYEVCQHLGFDDAMSHEREIERF